MIFDLVKNAHFSKIGFLFSLPIIFLGFLWGTSELPVSFLGLLIAGILATYLQFGLSFLKDLYKPIGMNTKNLKCIFIAIVVSFVLSIGLISFGKILGFASNENLFVSSLKGLPFADRLISIITVLISLFGEEAIVASILIPLLKIFSSRMSSKYAWTLAIIISSLFFGLMHYKAYSWNIYQMFIVISITRVPFDIVWIKTRSVLGGVLTHILYDSIVLIPMLFV
jgi:membrane protease YdiL (CAAX protease family)